MMRKKCIWLVKAFQFLHKKAIWKMFEQAHLFDAQQNG
jgi:hypothetical protein